ncbi:MAG TPA: pyridoxal phosphate-dependent aminotransferase [Pyrinomonadaceae bacterium]|nr:pyridoxal phosphate-dependent aminotransferase [Pyrinomonadaceae bacterium]
MGQGTCDLPPHPKVLEAARQAISVGHNSYTLFDGIPSLKQAVADRYRSYNKIEVQSENILITGGATGGLECICKCFLEPGDEVILFEPIYQYHVKLIEERGAVPRFIHLEPPNWEFSLAEMERQFSARTKLFVFANPNNPCGKVFSLAELEAIGDSCRSRGVIAVVDEVYEYILGEGSEHISLASLPRMFPHALTISSASKTFFVTGWRVGWLVSPEDVIDQLGVKSDETYICAPAPFQYAIADALQLGDEFFDQLRVPFIRRCEKMCDALTEAGLVPYVPQGAYYILADYNNLGYSTDIEAMNALIDKAGVGSIPGSAFFPSKQDTGLLRFCFALTDDLIDRGCELLTQFPLQK